eukprot:TRINITY_DN9793_c0_g1_i6.p1 TRINITY_DN9793_c0_g1~~TRINITY_DN9793_c0_g1_i6.p1  ORF type:complete len:309 (-),score=60.72 TRINITY_DN9793_c0_g1_i6:49-975(-)
MSLRGVACLESMSPAMDPARLGSTTPPRSGGCTDSSTLLLGMLRKEAAVSVLGYAHFGSALSLRSIARMGAALSVHDFASLGSTLYVRSFVGQYTTELNGVAPHNVLMMGATNTVKFTYSTDVLDVYVDGFKAMGLSSTGIGQFHGTWNIDYEIQYSDRRLKHNIVNLGETIEQNRDTQKDDVASGSTTKGVAQWLLDQLSPVSYEYKGNATAEKDGTKPTRFGFVEQEIRKSLPQLTRQNLTEAGTSGIVYQDLIAVLTYTLQEMGAGLSALGTRLMSIERRIKKRKHRKAVRRAAKRREKGQGQAT